MSWKACAAAFIVTLLVLIGLGALSGCSNSTTPSSQSEVEQAALDSVVLIKTTDGLGSGVVVEDGLILTNAHVVGDDDLVNVTFHDGVSLVAQVLWRGQRGATTDLALVRVTNPDPHYQFHPVKIRTTPVRIGERLFAIGHPFGLGWTVTHGAVSSLDRDLGAYSIGGLWLQIDVPINPGNSGGGLFDDRGRLVGINTLSRKDADNLAASIPVSMVCQFIVCGV